MGAGVAAGSTMALLQSAAMTSTAYISGAVTGAAFGGIFVPAREQKFFYAGAEQLPLDQNITFLVIKGTNIITHFIILN